MDRSGLHICWVTCVYSERLSETGTVMLVAVVGNEKGEGSEKGIKTYGLANFEAEVNGAFVGFPWRKEMKKLSIYYV